MRKQLKSHIHHRQRSSTASDKENNPNDEGRLSLDDLESDDFISDRKHEQTRSLDDSEVLT